MMSDKNKLSVQALQWQDGVLLVLDQRKLPDVVTYDHYKTAVGVAEAIKSMRVRGAPAIGIAAGYAVALSVKQHYQNHPDKWKNFVAKDIEILAASRPTAVNLFWALDLMQNFINKITNDPVREIEMLAIKIHQDDIAANKKMGKLGADILTDVKSVMTHCNAGALATGGYGTALGVIRSAVKRGLKTVYAGETRPWLQGVRLTAWELAQDNISVTVIADSAAGYLMKSEKIEWVIVGADRIAANGDVANKIGTYSLAVLARQHGVKLMVVAPTSTIDWEIENSEAISIEERNVNELLPEIYLNDHSLVGAWNPVFDVTPVELISAIVTENGVVVDPSVSGIGKLES